VGLARTSSSTPGTFLVPLGEVRSYLQSGQQPVPASFVAAAAVVANSATAAAVRANSFVFIVTSFQSRSGPSATQSA